MLARKHHFDGDWPEIHITPGKTMLSELGKLDRMNATFLKRCYRTCDLLAMNVMTTSALEHTSEMDCRSIIDFCLSLRETR